MLKITIKIGKLILNASSVSEDTTEHLFECSILQRLTQEEMKAINLETVDNMPELRRRDRHIERVNEIKNKIT